MKKKTINKVYQNQEFEIGDHKINYELHLSNRKSLQILIKPNGKIILKAWPSVKPDFINENLRKNLNWIVSKQNEILHKISNVKKLTYSDGDNYMLLGQEFALETKKCLIDSVNICNDKMLVTYKGLYSKDKIKLILTNWLKQQAFKIFNDVYTRVITDFDLPINSKVQIKVREMRSRWGSINIRTHLMTLNLKLVKAPIECIEYVIVHELCHLYHPNHGKDFYKLQAKYVPNWKLKRKQLEKLNLIEEVHE